MSTPSLPTYIREMQEQRERSMQTAFPAKVVTWNQSTNTVQLEPQFIETWRVDNERINETPDMQYPYIDNVPVLFPRSGDWAITFPIQAGSFGLVLCTKYSLDVWREKGRASDPGDLRRFTMSGAIFSPVNLHPNSSGLVPYDTGHMVIGDQSTGFADFVALAAQVKSALDLIKTHTHTYNPGPGAATETASSTGLTSMDTDTGSTTVKASL